MEDWVNIPVNYEKFEPPTYSENLKNILKEEIIKELKEELKKEIINEISLKNEQNKNLKQYYLTTGVSIYKK